MGLFQLISGCLMAVSTAANSAANVQAFGAFITILDFIASVLAVVYAYFVYVPCCVAVQEDIT